MFLQRSTEKIQTDSVIFTGRLDHDISGTDPELDHRGAIIVFSYKKSFLTLFFAIGNIAVWRLWPPLPPCIHPCGIVMSLSSSQNAIEEIESNTVTSMKISLL